MHEGACLKQTKIAPAVFVLSATVLVLFLATGVDAGHQKNLILATTTSTQDSGLLDVLIPMFEKKTGYFVKTVAVGSGQAMAMGQKGEADVLLVHSPDAEREFMAAAAGVDRKLVMHNDFVVVGPEADQARIRGERSAAGALGKIAASGSQFISRGDNSGTHAKERAIWKKAGVDPEGHQWYRQTGLGMGQTLSVASEKKAYTLTDRGTYVGLKKVLGLEILVQGDPMLLNIYHVITVNPGKWPKVNGPGGKAFADFMVSPQAQVAIGTFGVASYGTPLFFPDAGKKDEEPGK